MPEQDANAESIQQLRLGQRLNPGDFCPETGRTRLGYDRARILLAHYGDGLHLHQLRHSAAAHLGDANVIMAKTGHKSLRSV
ncbi:integrase [Saccharopolyspora lacisalsi]|uniref:Integrase n=1 Tax=Halosaccharopolyspora lacisalsi TaxID=1000566 RepID=A0A839DYR2_9PSEU|nr:hypothetical protein [Halosaccharopolyspora lacisalsi]MBA8823898.1 integrase [Halosaccharopolyspora lacisalsi]